MNQYLSTQEYREMAEHVADTPDGLSRLKKVADQYEKRQDLEDREAVRLAVLNEVLKLHTN